MLDSDNISLGSVVDCRSAVGNKNFGIDLDVTVAGVLAEANPPGGKERRRSLVLQEYLAGHPQESRLHLRGHRFLCICSHDVHHVHGAGLGAVFEV